MAELRLRRTIEIDASVERAFELYVDPAKLPEWRRAIRGIEHAEPLDRPGVHFVILWRGKFERTDAVVTRFERPRVQEVAITGRPPYSATATFAPGPNGGSSLRLDLALGVPLLLRPFLRLRMQGELANELDRFRALAESES